MVAERSDSAKPVTAARVRTGLPMPPHATGAVLAIRQTTAVSKGRKPRPIIIDAVTATGAPPPPSPSSTAPKANAIMHNEAVNMILARSMPAYHALLGCFPLLTES